MKCGRKNHCNVLNSAQNDLNKHFLLLVVKDNQSRLAYPITEEELLAKIQALKPRGSCGPDAILNYILKYKRHMFSTAIFKLFNLALSIGLFHDIWSNRIITLPVYIKTM